MMKLAPKVLGIAVMLTAMSAVPATAKSLDRAGKADLVMMNGQVRTPEGWAEALAVRDGVIVAVGDSKTVRALASGKTEVIDLKGRTVLPGLEDHHVHPLYGGVVEIMCKIGQGSNLEQTRNQIRACAEGTESGKWITGGQWDASALGRIPDRTLLDAVTPDNPVLLNDTSGHSAWVNSRALEIAGVTRDTPDPEGGIIERDADGNPTGILREMAIDIVRRHIPPISGEDIRKSLKWAINDMLSQGITGYTEASLGFVAGMRREAEIYAAMADAGEIKQRTRLCLTWAPGVEEVEEVIAARNLYARDRVAPDCIKIFLDGVPTDSHTAAMLDPYEGTVAGRDDEASRKGLLLVDQKELDRLVTRFDGMGMTVKFHAAGDAAVHAGLNAIEAARKANGFSGHMHNVGHCTFVAKADLPRARAIGATFEMSPYLWGPSPINDDITKAVGSDRIRRVWPVREALDAGALVVPGSDWAVVPSVSPWIGIETLITRERPGGSADSFGKPQAISVDEAIRMFTESAARHMGRENRLGRIEPGMLADVIVIDRNPYKIKPTEIHKTRVEMTFINGEKVYEARGAGKE